jgi:hypothetical protein
MLEFAVEATYPNDEAVITAIIMVSSAIQGVIIIELQRPLTKDYSYLPHAANVILFYLHKFSGFISTFFFAV